MVFFTRKVVRYTIVDMGEEDSSELSVNLSKEVLPNQETKGKSDIILIKDYPPQAREILKKILEEKDEALNDLRERASKEGEAPDIYEGLIGKAKSISLDIRVDKPGISISPECSYSWYPAESLPLLEGEASLLDSLEETLKKELEKATEPFKRKNLEFSLRELMRARKGIQAVRKSMEEKAKRDEEFSSSQELLWHTAPLWVIERILEKGALASRSYQLEEFGEIIFTSAGYLQLTENKVILKSPSGHEQIFDRKQVETGGIPGFKLLKRLDQEFHQVALSDSPYYSAYGSVCLVFSKASLLSRTQFMEADGYQLFDRKHDHKDPKGLAIDLTQEPFMLVAEEEAKTELIRFIQEKLTQNERWSAIIENPEEWVENNIIFVPKLRGKYRELDEQAKREFFRRKKIKIPEGHFVPTGNHGEDVARKSRYLYTYQCSS